MIKQHYHYHRRRRRRHYQNHQILQRKNNPLVNYTQSQILPSVCLYSADPAAFRKQLKTHYFSLAFSTC